MEHATPGHTKQQLLRCRQPIVGADARPGFEPQAATEVPLEGRHLDVVGHRRVVPAEANREAPVLIGKIDVDRGAHVLHLIARDEDLESGTEPMVGGARGVEAEDVRAPAEERSRVPGSYQARRDDVTVEVLGEVETGHELGHDRELYAGAFDKRGDEVSTSRWSRFRRAGGDQRGELVGEGSVDGLAGEEQAHVERADQGFEDQMGIAARRELARSIARSMMTAVRSRRSAQKAAVTSATSREVDEAAQQAYGSGCVRSRTRCCRLWPGPAP